MVNIILNIVGTIGAILLAFCGIPQMHKSIKDKHSNGLSWTFLLMWFVGELFVLIYVIPKKDLILISNYMMNIIIVMIILYYKIFPRRSNDK